MSYPNKFGYVSKNQKQDDGPQRVKIITDFTIDPTKQSHFKEQLEIVQTDIQNSFLYYNLQPQIIQNYVNYQNWEFSFMGSDNFEGRSISGILKFPPEFPERGPNFFFNPLPNGQVIQHSLIYGDSKLSLPLLSYWSSKRQIMQILSAIEQVFNNPIWAVDDAPANCSFAKLSRELQNDIQQRQAKLLPEFQKE